MGRKDKYLPKYVRSEFEAYIKCGRLEYGVLRVRCEDFHHEYLALDGLEDDPILLIASLQANSKDERSLPCKPLHLWQSRGLRQVVSQMWQASVSMQVL
tara:strand:- start:1193 stop:1489 length:297 start_codon:yes stop_codon:yes gene_type:complete